MVALDFPAAPTNGQVYNSWTYDGTKWELTSGGVETAPSSSVTAITPATNFTATLLMRRRGIWAFFSTTLTRITSNVGATTATVATIDAAGRGAFSAATQALTVRSATQADMRANTFANLNANTGVIEVQWDSTWNNGSSITFSGVVLMDSIP